MDMLKTRYRESILLNACIEAKQPVVIDNTNPTRAEREQYVNAFRNGQFRVVGYYFQSKLDECISRNNKRQGDSKISEIGIMSTYKKLELPFFDEGFDDLYYVSLVDEKFSVKAWQNEV